MDDLRVHSVHTTLVDLPLVRPHRFAVTSIEHQSAVIVRLRTADGIEGIGEAVVPGGPWWGGESIEGIKALIDGYIAPLIIGADVHRVEALARHLEKVIAGAQFAKAAVEMALWDARGKALGVPLYQLLGGLARDDIDVTWAIGIESVPVIVREIEAKLDEGAHRSFKLKMGHGDAADDVARIVSVARELEGSTSLRVDINGSWSELTATRWLPVLEEAGIDLIEQPVAAWNIEAQARLASRLVVPIMADESLRTAEDAMRLAQHGAADVFAVKIAKSAGLSAVQRIAAIGEAAGIGCHGGTTIETSVGAAASAHLFCAVPGIDTGSELFGPLLLADDIVKEPIPYVNGRVAPPHGAGLGVQLDESKVRKYARPI
ncbi:muconate/chloromuconate family cycloisomerase [Aeromicrobium alkaliterrae]|uniref:Muconate/chloromuconate family cycloisomerase n=1 Tax=Aeromicrobium alkaliterrae TaxID=302168 RepID=A0ABN2KEQ2_9ACTN